MARVARKIQLERKQIKEHEARKVEMFERAIKTGGAHTQLDFIQMPPRAGVEALTDYVGRLEVMRDDLQSEFGDLREFTNASRWLSTEISLALQEIVKLNIRIEAGGP